MEAFSHLPFVVLVCLYFFSCSKSKQVLWPTAGDVRKLMCGNSASWEGGGMQNIRNIRIRYQDSCRIFYSLLIAFVSALIVALSESLAGFLN